MYRQIVQAHIAATLLVGPIAYGQSLVCAEESVAGILFNPSTKTWSAAIVRPSAKYVLRKSSNPLAKLEVGRVGQKEPVAFCESDFEKDQVRCRGFFQEFYFDRKDMRFVQVYTAGFWNESALRSILPERKEGADTPSVSAGSCTGL